MCIMIKKFLFGEVFTMAVMFCKRGGSGCVWYEGSGCVWYWYGIFVCFVCVIVQSATK